MKRGAPPILRPGLELLQPYQPGKPVEEVERELGVAGAIKLASNENAWGPSRSVKAALRQALAKIHMYPDGSGYVLRQRLARYWQVSPDEILLGNGSNELLVLLGRAYLQPGDQVLTSQMSFVVYEMVARLMNADFLAVPMRDYTYDLPAMAKALSSRTRMVYIANPNNPTGTCVAPADLKGFIEDVPADCLVVLDEAYIEYMDKRMRPDSIHWVLERENLVALRTFSKAYALAGLRIGYGIATPKIKADIDRIRDPFNVNFLAQVAAQAALADRRAMLAGVKVARTERKRITRALQASGLQVVPSQTNFIFVRLAEGEGRQVAELLMRQGVIVRPFPGPHLRMTLGRPAENDKLIKALRRVLN